MKIFELPKMEISKFETENVLTLSGGTDPVTVNTLNRGSGNAAGRDIISDSIDTYSIAYTDMSL